MKGFSAAYSPIGMSIRSMGSREQDPCAHNWIKVKWSGQRDRRHCRSSIIIWTEGPGRIAGQQQVADSLSKKSHVSEQ